MNAQSLNQWLTLIANVSVVAGIIFLAVEIRQNTESQNEFVRVAQAKAYQARAFAASSTWSTFASSSEVIDTSAAFNDAAGKDAAKDALASISDQDRARMYYIALAQVAILDNNFYRYRQGYLDPDHYHTIDATNLRSMLPLFDAFGIVYPSAMAEEVERLRQQ